MNFRNLLLCFCTLKWIYSIGRLEYLSSQTPYKRALRPSLPLPDLCLARIERRVQCPLVTAPDGTGKGLFFGGTFNPLSPDFPPWKLAAFAEVINSIS
jgi:hypothetical protein